VVLHQPIIVTFGIHNGTPEAVRLDLGLGATRNFIVRVVRPDGVVVVSPRVPALKDGPFDPGRRTVAALGDYGQKLVLNEWFRFDQPGSYIIDIDLASTIANHSGATIDAARRGFVTVHVGARNDNLLNGICQELVWRILSTTDVGSRYVAAAQLAHVDDALALPYVKQILDETDTVDQFLFAGLVRLGTTEARAILVDMAQSDHEGRASQAASALIEFDRKVA
jgi:hypothetical protein